jgi:hypothetical protein
MVTVTKYFPLLMYDDVIADAFVHVFSILIQADAQFWLLYFWFLPVTSGSLSLALEGICCEFLTRCNLIK